MEHFKDSSFESFELQVTDAAKSHLKAAGGWGLFISIIGFIFLGLGLLGCLFFVIGASAMPDGAMPDGAMPFSGAGFGIASLFFTALWAIPIVTLFKFSTKVRNAVDDMNTDQFTQAMANLKYNLMFAGIMIIVTIVFYFVAMIYAFSMVASMRGGHFN